MPQRTIPAEKSTRDLTKAVKNLYSVESYNALLLEVLAQYDPDVQVLGDDLTQEEKVASVVSQHDIPQQMLGGLNLDLDSEQELTDSDEAVTT